MKDRFVKIKYNDTFCIYEIANGLEEINEFIQYSEPGDSWETEVVEMTREEFENLDEFTGW